jgi:hypothetical protein
VVFALLHFSNAYAPEKWRHFPVPRRRLLKNEFINNLRAFNLVGQVCVSTDFPAHPDGKSISNIHRYHFLNCHG